MSDSRQVRIISGQWRGSKLPVVESQGLRPTGDRVRETLFNWLAPHIHEARCLDLFAGTGVLGFEALSRGAQSVDAYETASPAVRSLEAVKNKLNAEHYTVVKKSAIGGTVDDRALPYDLVFVDPPFAEELLQQAVDWLHRESVVADRGLIYIERPSKESEPVVPATWELLKAKRFGAVQASLYQHCESLS